MDIRAYERQYFSAGHYEQDPGGYPDLTVGECVDHAHPSFQSPIQGHSHPQQRQPYHPGAPWNASAANSSQWQGGAYGSQESDTHWSFPQESYYGSTASTSEDYRNFYQDRSRHIQGDLAGHTSPDTRAAQRQYGTGSSGATDDQSWRQASAARHVSHSYASEAYRRYSNYPQPVQGMHGYTSEAPALRVDAPVENEYTAHLSHSTNAGGSHVDSRYGVSGVALPMLSPYSKIKGEGDQRSANSPTPGPQGPPSPSGTSGADEPNRKWKCKQAECAERKGFKRHADLMRHMTTVHHKDGMEKFSCTRRGCPRKGENGFTRRDHLVEHLRNFHVQDIPKRKGGRGKTRE